MVGTKPLIQLLFSFSLLLLYAGLAAQTSALPSLAKKQQGEEAAQSYWELAQSYADPTLNYYQPDSAYLYAAETGNALKKLSKRAKNRLAEVGVSAKSARRLRSKMKEQALEVALSQNTLSAIEGYIDRYPRIARKLEERALAQFYKLKLDALVQAGDFDNFLAFYQKEESELKKSEKTLQNAYNLAAYQLYFAQHDATDLLDLIGLIEVFPRLAAQVDGALAAAVAKKPYIDLIEKRLKRVKKKYIPKTVWAIYEYYRFEGSLEQLFGFGNNYPQYVNDSRYRRDLAIAKKAVPLWEGLSNDKLGLLSEYILDAAPCYDAFFFLQSLIKPLIDTEQWAEAIQQVEQYQSAFGESHPLIVGLLALLKSEEQKASVEDLGFSINTVAGEYSPVITADEAQIFFCRKMANGDEEIYVAERTGDVWTGAKALKGINSVEKFEAPLAISTDGNTLLLFQNGEVKMSKRGQRGWEEPRDLFPGIKKKFWQGGTSISSDGKVIIFAARREDRIGLPIQNNVDLFITVEQEDGTWSKPMNMGLNINTPLEERSPFLHPDMRTLYFSSNGRGGLGNMDVFKTTRVGDSWTEWTTPVNLGKAINTSGRDWGYRINTAGDKAYFAADTEYFKENLFAVELPQAVRPNQVATISGLLRGINDEAIVGTIKIENLETGEIVSIVEPDPMTGKFIITLPVGVRYGYVVEGDNLFPKANNLDLRTNPEQLRYTENIQVPTIDQMVEKTLAIPLKNLFFETSKYEIQPTSYLELDRLQQLLEQYDLSIEVSGHTDNVGGAAYNKTLSRNRANAVRDYLIQKGSDPSRIKAKGEGADQAVASNEDEAGRALNRRVEIRFLPNDK
ncbi:MAG: OmpA family protein [Bacteroidota bacterium]